MVMSVNLYDAAMACNAEHKAHRIYLSPKGKGDQQTVIRLSKAPPDPICGRYEGVDQNPIDCR